MVSVSAIVVSSKRLKIGSELLIFGAERLHCGVVLVESGEEFVAKLLKSSLLLIDMPVAVLFVNRLVLLIGHSLPLEIDVYYVQSVLSPERDSTLYVVYSQ